MISLQTATAAQPASAPVIAYVGLGSNLQAPQQQIALARTSILAHPEISEIAFSSLYHSPPMGPQDQPDYCNAVLAIHTELSAIALLDFLQSIENQQGRVRQAQRWVARTLDLDILLYADQKIQSPRLTIPHPGMAERAFVLYPLYEIAPDLSIPALGELSQLLHHCPLNGLQRI